MAASLPSTATWRALNRTNRLIYPYYTTTAHGNTSAPEAVPLLRRGLSVASGHKLNNISRKPAIIQSQLKRKIKRGLDRLPSQGPDPAAAYSNGWRLAAAAVLERYPLVIPEPHPFEEEYQRGKFLDKQSKARPAPVEWFLTEKDRINKVKEPTIDDPRAELYVPGPLRTPEIDQDVTNIKRHLDERLYFVVRAPKKKSFQFPQVVCADTSVTMREYTQKALHSVLPPEQRPPVHHISYYPTCHLEHIFPKAYQDKHDVYGVKLFFYRIMLMNPNKYIIRHLNKDHEFAWATEKELESMLSRDYYSAIKPLLFGVGPY